MEEVFTVRDERDYAEVLDRIVGLCDEYDLSTIEAVGVLRLAEMTLLRESEVHDGD